MVVCLLVLESSTISAPFLNTSPQVSLNSHILRPPVGTDLAHLMRAAVPLMCLASSFAICFIDSVFNIVLCLRGLKLLISY